MTASPWQHVQLADGTRAYGWINLPAMLIVMIISLILIKGIKQSAFVNTIMVLIKVSVTLAFIGVGFFYIDPKNYVPFLPANTGTFGEYGWSGVLRAAGIVFFAYIGFDVCVHSGSEKPKGLRKIYLSGDLRLFMYMHTYLHLFCFCYDRTR